MGILLYRTQTLHAAAPTVLRHKATGALWEEQPERAACVIAVAAEARHEAPISEETHDKEFVQPWKRGDGQIDFEVEAALIGKAESFKATVNIQALKRLADASILPHQGNPLTESRSPAWTLTLSIC